MTGAARTRAIDSERLTPTDVSNLLGISYERLLRYAREMESRGQLKPLREAGRMYFAPSDLESLRRYHEEQPRGTRFNVGGDVDLHESIVREVGFLTGQLEALLRRSAALLARVKKAPAASTSWIRTLPVTGITLRHPIPVTVTAEGKAFLASAADVGSTASGRNRLEAVRRLRVRLAAEFVFLEQLSSPREEDAARLAELQRFIVDAGEASPPGTRRYEASTGGWGRHDRQATLFWMAQGLSTRTANALATAGIESFDQLEAAQDRLAGLSHLGKVGKREVLELLARRRGAP